MTDLNVKFQDKDFLEGMNELNIGKDDLLNNFAINSSLNSDKKDKITALKRVAESYEMELRGRELVKIGDKEQYIQTGRALAGDVFIRQTGSILRSFAEESNLIGKKTENDAIMQFMEAFEKVNNFGLRDKSVKEERYRTILKIFKDRLWNVIDVIRNTDGNMGAVMGRLPEQNVQDFLPIGGGLQK